MENRYLRQYRSEEFQEEDVWAVVKEESKTGFKIGESSGCPRTPHSFSRRLPSAARMIPGAQKHQHIDNSKKLELVQSSAPVDVPDWSKIYGKSPIKNNNGSCSSFLDRNRDGNDYYVIRDAAGSDGDEDYEGYENDYDGDGELPPHEWLAKKLARSQISSFSVCEGVGRTLKGRDLSRVANGDAGPRGLTRHDIYVACRDRLENTLRFLQDKCNITPQDICQLVCLDVDHLTELELARRQSTQLPSVANKQQVKYVEARLAALARRAQI